MAAHHFQVLFLYAYNAQKDALILLHKVLFNNGFHASLDKDHETRDHGEFEVPHLG